jgi:hypothetical protein
MEKTKSPQRSETMVGWISRNSCQGPVKAELFFLTSLFIELIAPDFLANIWRKLVQTPGYNSYAAGASRYDDHVCFALLPGESREVRNHALPSTILLHKYICRPFLRAEAFDLLASFRTKLSMISAKERGSGYVEEQAHRGADHRGAEATGSGGDHCPKVQPVSFHLDMGSPCWRFRS